jgi:uncharacterized protein with PQ loop repeat
MLSLLGLFAGCCFAFCGVPAAWSAFKTKKTMTPTSIAAMIFVGAITMYVYLFLLYGFNPVLTFNYIIEMVSWGIVLRYCLAKKAI